MSWIYLILAGLLEAFWAVGLKYTVGFTHPIPSILVGAAIIGSMLLMSLAFKTIPVATGYAVWVSIGVVGAAIAGPILFKQPLSLAQVCFMVLLVISIIGLKLTTPTEQ